MLATPAGEDTGENVAAPAAAPRPRAYYEEDDLDAALYDEGEAAPVRRAPGRTNPVIPSIREPVRMALGLLIAAAGGLLLFLYLPGKQPLEGASAAELIGRFPAHIHAAAQAAAGMLIGFGALVFIVGAVYKPSAEVRCKRCKMWVMVNKDGFVLRCTRVRHPAGMSWGSVALAGLFGVLVTAIMFLVAIGNITRAGGG
jgi:hypothetical protein